jgi:hypothetical protein
LRDDVTVWRPFAHVATCTKCSPGRGATQGIRFDLNVMALGVLSDLCVQPSVRSQVPSAISGRIARSINAGTRLRLPKSSRGKLRRGRAEARSQLHERRRVAEDAENGGSIILCVLGDLGVQPFSAISGAPRDLRLVRRIDAGNAGNAERDLFEFSACLRCRGFHPAAPPQIQRQDHRERIAKGTTGCISRRMAHPSAGTSLRTARRSLTSTSQWGTVG